MFITKDTDYKDLFDKLLICIEVFDSKTDKLFFEEYIHLKHLEIVLPIINLNHISQFDGGFTIKIEDFKKLKMFFLSKNQSEISKVELNHQTLELFVSISEKTHQ